MGLQSTIKEALKVAMKEKDQVKLDTLRGVLSAVTNELVASGKTPQDEADDAIVLKVIARLVKQRKDAIEQFTAGGRSELADAERAQLTVLEAYLPPQMSEEDIKEIALRKQAELGVSDKSKLGILVGAVMKEISGQADGAAVKKVVEELFV